MASALKDSSRGSSEGRERHRARNTLVVAQVALAAVLLVASGLMVRTFLAIRDVPPGFQNPEERPDAAHLHSDRRWSPIRRRSRACTKQIAHRIEAIGGVESVGVASSVTMDGNSNNDPIWVEDFPEADAKIPPLRRMKYLGARLLRDDGQSGHRRPRLDVDRRPQRARRWRCSARTSRANTGASRPRRSASASGAPRRPPWIEIVGVVGNERQDGATKPAPTIDLLADEGVAADRRAGVRAALAGLCDSLVAPAVARLPRRSAAGGVERQSEPAARARADAAADLRRVDGADAVRAGDPRHRRVGDAAARPGRHLRRDRLHRVAAAPRSRHSHGARRAERLGAAHLRQRAACR